MWRKKSVVWASEAWEINWIRFPTTEGMVQLPRGSTRARKVAKQQIGVTVNSRARDGVIFSQIKKMYFFVFGSTFLSIFIFFQFLQFEKKNCGTIARATSLYIRKTFRGPQKTGSRATSGPLANTLATLGLRPSISSMSTDSLAMLTIQ